MLTLPGFAAENSSHASDTDPPPDFAVVELSLRDALSHADSLATVEGRTPGETVAMIEYLLALCFASGTFPATNREWFDWVVHERDLSAAAQWLSDQPDDDWDLFHPEAPLGQNIQLAPHMADFGTGPAQLVIEHAGDYSQHFDHRHLVHGAPLSAAEAFRALLTQHVYGLAGRARLSGKETLGPAVTNLATGRLQSRVRVVATGRTLGETLRLNLSPHSGDPGQFNQSWTTGKIHRRGFDRKPPPRAVQGPADLHSALGRSILLRPKETPDGVVVDRVLIGAGELLELEDDLHLQDAVWNTALNGQTKPLWPSPTRALWRDAHALYSAARNAARGMYPRLRSLPVPEDETEVPYQLHVVGLIANKTLPITWTEGSYPYRRDRADRLYRASRRGSDIAEYIARHLNRAAWVAAQIVYPNPKPSDQAGQVARFDARWEFWPAAADPFYVLLSETAAGASETDCLLEYAALLESSARDFLAHRLDSLPRSSQSNRARALAEQTFNRGMTDPKAPAEIRGETPHDDGE